MFYKFIEKKRNEWLESENCVAKQLLSYIQKHGILRDAQVEAIKTYLFLKIACKNKPLYELFTEGFFNSLDLDSLELTSTARRFLEKNPAALALLEYSMLQTRDGKQLAPELEKAIKQSPESIDYAGAFRDIFYGVDYADYLFSLPMGAGKTYLMASFIYLDLYFAKNEPDNPAFAHNFMVLAPSGLKSSIVPSLKTIRNFDPSWVIPEPAATELKRLIKFEILDEQKSANKSNRIKNPNAQKINLHLSYPVPMGLVAVTNAEKVILDRVGEIDSSDLFSEEEKNRIRLANELREVIGRIPQLSIFIDEVHHAADGEIKLRQVVNAWSRNHSFCGMLGFSGTPYLEKAETVEFTKELKIKNSDLSNVVYHYPLIQGIGNFLKNPDVKHADITTEEIVRNGVNEFLDLYGTTTYANGTCAKLAIYCGQIEPLEENIYPLVAEIVSSRGMNPTDVILKFHGGNKEYPVPEGSETAFASLDTSISKIRIVLLAQIGKEGWDCKSLTGVILPQKGACPTNMVLQTSCRCLRQVDRGAKETALIWLNKQNADTLNKQLKQQQNISLQEFSSKKSDDLTELKRYSRIEKLKVPPIDFYQLKVSYETLIVEERNDVRARLQKPDVLVKNEMQIGHEQDMTGEETGHFEIENNTNFGNERTTFSAWLHAIAKESFGSLTMTDLNAYRELLQKIYNQTNSPEFDQAQVRAQIRKAFIPYREIRVKEEVVAKTANLLKIDFAPTVSVENTMLFYPDQSTVEEIVDWDENPKNVELSDEQKKLLEQLSKTGVDISAMAAPQDPHPERSQTYHYLPYHFDSRLEIEYFAKSILPILKNKQLEIYYNGDDNLTEFKICCYHNDGVHWRYIGMYVPDFLVIQRGTDGCIYKVIIVETKGKGFAAKFAEKRKFMQTEFLKKNNEKFGYPRFDFLYLEDTLTKEQREQKTIDVIKNFFELAEVNR